MGIVREQIKNTLRKISQSNKFKSSARILFEDILTEQNALIHHTPPQEFVPNGHFYSPIASIEEIDRDKERIYEEKTLDDLPNIEFDFTGQILLLNQFKNYMPKCIFYENEETGSRYFYNNEFFSLEDASVLFCMLLHFKPQKMVEVGSGFSSAAALDANSQLLGDTINFTFIEPYPDRLYSLLKQKERQITKIYTCRVQDIDKKIFLDLEKNDILFIDSSHVSKTGSDVNYLLFDVFPLLKPGVIIHFHDIFWPFEIPKTWAFQGRNWNETYILRAFLEHNKDYSVLFWGQLLRCFAHEDFYATFPLAKKPGGGSIWLIKK